MKGRWRPANSEHAEQVVGRDGGRRKKSDERHWGRARGDPRSGRARDASPAGSRADFFQSPESRPTYWPP
uniref:Btz domain-containing protein n=1 Tax=Globodera pallida TaxID=36090 RepID=A0A183BMQ2_GLOPA